MRTASRVLILPFLASHALVTNPKELTSTDEIGKILQQKDFKEQDLEEVLNKEWVKEREFMDKKMLIDGGERVEELITAAALIDNALEKYHPTFRKSGRDINTPQMNRIRRSTTRIIMELMDNDNDGVVTWHEFIDSHYDVLEHFTWPHPVSVDRLWHAWVGMVSEQLVGTTNLAMRYAQATTKAKLTIDGLTRFESWMNPYALSNRIDRILAHYETKRCSDCAAAMAEAVNKYTARQIAEAALRKGKPEIFPGSPDVPGDGDVISGRDYHEVEKYKADNSGRRK